MKLLKTTAALAITVALLAGCNDEETVNNYLPESTDVTFAAYNVSFDRTAYADLVAEMQIEPSTQDVLVRSFLDGTIADADKETASKVIQIRNVAAVIQKNRPDVIMMGEYNNDGTGTDTTSLQGFQDNYLSIAQSTDGAGGVSNLAPIEYPYKKGYATNTGLFSGLDLDNNGAIEQGPYGDNWGFGQFHGKYAFALMSKYEIDSQNTRTFQTFKWKDLEGQTIPTITDCSDPTKFPDGMDCGDEWYTAEEWEEIRISSKNHVDAPIIIPTKNGDKIVHVLMSHPTPPVFDTGKNKSQNAAEVEFWNQYVQGKSFFYDDAGTTGGLAANAKFVVMGDLNTDSAAGDGERDVIAALKNNPLLDQDVMNGELYPTSFGAAEFAADESSTHPMPNRITSTFGIGVDYAMPSANLNVKATGVYWPASYEDGRKLVIDTRLEPATEDGKGVSSDHRLVWIKAEL